MEYRISHSYQSVSPTWSSYMDQEAPTEASSSANRQATSIPRQKTHVVEILERA